MSSNYDFIGPMPVGVNIQDNVNRALEYQKNHTTSETLDWFKDVVRNNKDGHLPLHESMDYKQINPSYADFGNYNYAVVGKTLGYSDFLL
jgi:hypothetical protein